MVRLDMKMPTHRWHWVLRRPYQSSRLPCLSKVFNEVLQSDCIEKVMMDPHSAGDVDFPSAYQFAVTFKTYGMPVHISLKRLGYVNTALLDL